MTKPNRQNRQQPPTNIAPAPVVQFQHQQYSGILPHPDLFVGYNRGVPDAAERILVMAEELQRETIAADKEIISVQKYDVLEGWKFAHWGQFLGFFVVVMYFVILGLTVCFNNLTMFGVIAGTGAIAGLPSLVRAFQRRENKPIPSPPTPL